MVIDAYESLLTSTQLRHFWGAAQLFDTHTHTHTHTEREREREREGERERERCTFMRICVDLADLPRQ